MNRIAFYAPMHPLQPDAPPSGDRAMAGLLTATLRKAGYAPETASALRSYDPSGDPARQAAIAAAAGSEIEQLIADWRASPPKAWVTYLNYYKAPDHLGSKVSAALGIPYVIVEASHAAKRAAGNFAAPYAAAKAALEAAAAVVAMTDHDAIGLAKVVPANRLHHLSPFIDVAPYAALGRPLNRTPVIFSAAMLRPGKKLANFPLIAAALAQLADLDWHYLIAGDGPGRAGTEQLFGAFPSHRITFAGAFPPEAMPRLHARADLYLWPGLKEGYGLSYLEAQAAATPVVACTTAGVPAVVDAGRGGLLVPPDDPAALAGTLRVLLMNRQTRETMGEVARAFVFGERTIDIAAQHLRTILQSVGA